MRYRSFGFITAALLIALPAYAEKKCELQRYAELPVTMAGTRPHITGTINGQPAHFLADSGAFFSILTREAAEKYQLKVGPSPITVRGTGGFEKTGLTRVKEFTLAGFGGGRVIKDVDFFIGSNNFAQDGDGIIGQNVLGGADTEFDLANGFIRMFRAKDCRSRALAYWAGGASVAEIEIESRDPLHPHLIGHAKINGKRIRITFDTGAWRSILNLDAAARVGIKPENEDVAAAGIGHGLGKQTHENWIARFDSLDLGGEVIKNARLRMGDLSLLGNTDMLLGADFFLSHRIYVAANQHKIYFTYNGGPVFDLRANRSDRNIPVTASTPTATSPTATSAAESKPTPKPALASIAAATATATPAPTSNATDTRATPTDADGFKRRGAASTGRNDFVSAIADFDQAIKLDAADSENYFQRGLAHWQNRNPQLAINDLDEALKLKPNYIDALRARGSMRLARKNIIGAREDLNAAANLAPSDATLHLQIAQVFQSAGDFDDAIVRYGAWIDANRKDDRLPEVLSSRCAARAMANKELDLALADCNIALKKGTRNSQDYDNRALVFLRLANYDKAIVDYKASEKLQPKKPWTLYGLGLAEIKKGLKADGDKDIQAAVAINPAIAQMFGRIGLTPQM